MVYRDVTAPVFPASPAHDEDAETGDERLHHHQGISRQQLINRLVLEKVRLVRKADPGLRGDATGIMLG